MKSLSVKQNVTFAGTNALARYTSSGGIRRHLPLEGEGKGEIVPRGSTNEGNFGVRQSVNRFDIMLSMVWKAHCFFIRFSISLFVAPISSSAYSPDTASARIL